MDDLIQEFIAETRETLAALASEVVAWETDPEDRARLDAIFRFVHTVKGSCGFLDLPRLSRLSHAAEDGLQAVRDGRRVPDQGFVDGVLAVIDRIGQVVEAIDAGIGLDDSDDEDLVRALAESDAPAPAAPATTPDRPGDPAQRQRAPRTVRLGVDLLDRMMAGMSDLVLVRNELSRRVRGGGADPGVEAALERLSATVGELRETVSRTRMQKLDALFSALPRIVRDTAADLGKSVALTLEGGDVELDREMVEMVRDPLTHILRNAIDHGLERTAARTAAGKPATGRIRIVARQVGNQIEIAIADDGRGIDTDRLVARLLASGEIDPMAAQRMDDAARLALVFRPGASTADTVTALSGRGVGMDVVRENIERIGGVVQLLNAPGQGLRVILRVPLTLSIIAAISLNAGGCTLALPRSAIEEITTLANPQLGIETLGDATVVRLRGRSLPAVRLGALLGRDGPGEGAGIVMVVNGGGGSYALIADAIGDHEELVIKPAAPQVMAAGIYAGEALPDSGQPLLILDAAGVAAAAGIRFAAEGFAPAVEDADVAAKDTGTEHLLFATLAGDTALVPLALVDRILPLGADAVGVVGDGCYVTVNGMLLRLVGVIPAEVSRARQALLLRDGDRHVLLAIAEAQEILAIPGDAPATGSGDAAVVAIGDRLVRRIDTARLLPAAEPARPAIRLDAADGWSDHILRPLLQGAGWTVRGAGEPGGPDDILIRGDQADPAGGAAAAVLRIAARDGETRIARHDLPGILAAVAKAVGE